MCLTTDTAEVTVLPEAAVTAGDAIELRGGAHLDTTVVAGIRRW
jgi:hypothetical protein